ncbi:MAG: zinc ribbon domain-containing protein [Alphaproteobacteria bacterium]|nr:zinc ribbon domain-containing protein [Alphaproteobacteria bacterium]
MPVHDYLCEACGGSFEFLTLSHDEAVACAACGSGRVTRQVVSRIAVRGANQRRGGVVDLSSGACPCSGPGHRHS